MARSNNNKLKAYVRFSGDGRVIPSSLIVQAFKPKVGNWKEINANECCNYTTTTTTTLAPTTTSTSTTSIVHNFDVESTNWAGAGITNQATFNSILGVTTGAFVITGNKIEAEILTAGSILDIKGMSVININYITFPGIQTLDLTDNNITEFNPIKALPSTLTNITFENSEMTFFNPSIPLPISLTVLSLSGNLIDDAGYTISETWATAQPSFTNTCNIQFTLNIDSVSGTNLETILLTKNTTITA